MPHVTYASAAGAERTFEAHDGESAMHVAVSNLVPGIIGECGGELSCATCHVYVDATWIDKLDPMSSDEEGMLEAAAAEPTENSRLSCQIKFSAKLDGLVVHIPSEQ